MATKTKITRTSVGTTTRSTVKGSAKIDKQGTVGMKDVSSRKGAAVGAKDAGSVFKKGTTKVTR